MDQDVVLTAFDQRVRRRPIPDPPDGRVEDAGTVVRLAGAWNGVVWSDLARTDADAVIAEQVRRFAGVSWEWKHYSYDEPADLPERLVAAGFTPEQEEALLVADIADLDLGVRPVPGVELRAVEDERDVAAFVAVHDEVFGGDYSRLGRTLLTALREHPGTAAAVVAWAGEVPVSAARAEFHAGTGFVSLWGGGTLPAWRGRGVFRSLVAYRAALAEARGFRYLQVDASPDSRPILRRLGFTELATTTPFVHP
ncbi:GNAT family N-acetyltransferase [Actinomadura sp. DC4]|uniref:GNAT family N-acetyltransferase n=1 Tax=Actinomadura sp. DC4 TaxID=3055069 RepID=UPI0025B19840|nr:GNAT family N-acetyltransferase [Actinomadura sp. DC4]MDN3360079.1 GNAT family N-acetyltransferase [Actinomadura sp. DC4]